MLFGRRDVPIHAIRRELLHVDVQISDIVDIARNKSNTKSPSCIIVKKQTNKTGSFNRMVLHGTGKCNMCFAQISWDIL